MDTNRRQLGRLGCPQAAPGFTLVELLVVILIIALISILALPTVVSGLRHRQSSEAARLLQGELAGARDRAIHQNAPAGIRLLPDPIFPLGRLPDGTIDPRNILASNRVIALETAPNYTDGRIAVFPAEIYPPAVTGGVPCLVVEEAPFDSQALPNPPTSWFWNIRRGDKIQIGTAGPWYTIIGPMIVGPAQGNSELFVNVGPPGTRSPLVRGNTHPEFLLLVNGRDDNGNGWVDEGADGVDNNNNQLIDEPAEWEQERWLGALGGS